MSTPNGAEHTSPNPQARAALYVGAVSSGLVALGFFGQAAERGIAFTVFALIVLPTLYMLGVFTFARLIASSDEDLLYGRAINRIRNYYLQVAGSQVHFVMLGGHDDPLGVLANMGIDRPSRWQQHTHDVGRENREVLFPSSTSV